jgi:transketolase
MRQAFPDALVSAAVSDPKVLLLTGDHGYALFDSFRKICSNQYINCGIAEQNMVGVAAGLAKAGFKPIVYGLAAFIPVRVLEQIKIDVCYENLPVIFVGDGAGLVYSHLGASHQSTEDIACTRAIPQITILSPADRFELTAAIDLAIQLNAPVYLRIGKGDCGDVHKASVKLSPGELLQVRKGKKRIAFLATGSMVIKAVILAENKYDAEVWSVPSIKPINSITLAEISKRVDCIVTFEEHSVIGGLGSCIAEEISKGMPVSILRLGVNDRFSKVCGSWDYLLEDQQLDIAHLENQISRHLSTLGL